MHRSARPNSICFDKFGQERVRVLLAKQFFVDYAGNWYLDYSNLEKVERHALDSLFCWTVQFRRPVSFSNGHSVLGNLKQASRSRSESANGLWIVANFRLDEIECTLTKLIENVEISECVWWWIESCSDHCVFYCAQAIARTSAAAAHSVSWAASLAAWQGWRRVRIPRTVVGIYKNCGSHWCSLGIRPAGTRCGRSV